MIVSKLFLRAICLVVGLLCLLYGGSAYIFSVYTNSFKKKYGYTQSEIGIISGFGNVGAAFAFPPGLMMDKLGPRITACLAIALATSGYLLLWSAANDPSFYTDKVWLICLYLFLAYFSSNVSYMAGLVTNMRNFRGRLFGTMVAVLETAYALGSSIFIAIYGGFFINGHVEDEENQDIGGFFLFMAITGAVVNGLGALFLGYYDTSEVVLPGQDDYENLDEVSGEFPEHDDRESDAVEDESDSAVENVTGLTLIKNWDFQFLFWIFVLSSCEILMFITNIDVYLKSFGYEDKSTAFNLLVPIFAVISKFVCGILSDRFIEKIPRTVYTLVVLIIETSALTLCIFASSNLYVLVFATVSVGITYGAVWSISATLCGEYFGLKYFGKNWGAFVLSNGICSIFLQQIFGALYQAEIPLPGETFCYGVRCFKWSFAMAAVLAGSAALFNVGLIERRRRLESEK